MSESGHKAVPPRYDIVAAYRGSESTQWMTLGSSNRRERFVLLDGKVYISQGVSRMRIEMHRLDETSEALMMSRSLRS